MKTPSLLRVLEGGETGRDVYLVQRALNRWLGDGIPIPASGVYDRRTKDRLMAFQLEQNLRPADGRLDEATFRALWPFFDAYGRWRYGLLRVPSQQDAAFDRLLKAMKTLSSHSIGYRLGAGHGRPLSSLRADDYYDCSSSTSKVLYDAGLFPEDKAWVSGTFARRYGEPGRGRYFTVWANDGHVFIQLHRSRWWRFDTSPHADGQPSEDSRRGPRLRYFPRSTRSFTPRHYQGM